MVWRPTWMAVAAAPFLAVCSLYGAAKPPPADAPIPRAAADAAAAQAVPGEYGDCGPGAIPETGVQGQVPMADQASGRSKLGYRCNVRLVGQNDIDRRGANMQLAWYRDCAYISIIGVREYFPTTANPAVEGIAVIDASDPRRPELVQIIRSPAGRNEHEGLEVNQPRGMLVAQQGGVSARYIEIYDVSKDCRHPELKARYDAGERIYHGLKISDDGMTVYATDGIGFGSPEQPLHVFDVSDMSKPRLIKKWGPGDAPGEPFYISHDVDLSHDGTRAFLGATPLLNSLTGLGLYPPDDSRPGPTMVTLDTTEIRDRKPSPALKVLSRVETPNFGHTIQRAVIGGKPFVIASGESPFASGLNCGWAWGYLIDMSDERNPKVVSQIKLEVNEVRNCEATRADEVIYSIHYAGVDDERNTTKLFYTYYGAGLRVFDVRDPAHPKEIAYYHPPAQPDTVLDPLAGTLGGDGHTPGWDSATSVVRYRPESGQIWFASVAGGLNIVELTGEHACVPAAARSRGTTLGAAVLGRTRVAQRAALPARPRRQGRVDSYCTTDGRRLRVSYVRGRAQRLLSNSPYASARGINPGMRVGELRRRLKGERRVRIGASTWYYARGGRARALYRTRRGLVREVGIEMSISSPAVRLTGEHPTRRKR